jgi:hypothetical protein
MPNPAPVPSTNQVYNDGGIQYGSIVVLNLNIGPSYTGGSFPPNGNLRGAYILENVTISRPLKVIRKPDEIGGPNGSVDVADFVTGSCVIQMGDNSTYRPKNGDWFSYTFDSQIGLEYFRLQDCDDPREMNGYWKCNAKLMKCYFPTVPSTFVPQ